MHATSYACIKEREFQKKLSRALRLDSATAEVLAGDFAHDAILVRAERLAKQEVRLTAAPPCMTDYTCSSSLLTHQTQALAEKQSAFYAAQRQLKTCRQNLESKELLLGLLQKKVASLEERVQSCSRQEAQLESMSGKVRSMGNSSSTVNLNLWLFIIYYNCYYIHACCIIQ